MFTFDGIEDLTRFSIFDIQANGIQCKNCGTHENLILHGYSYKTQNIYKIKTGRRFFCSNRWNKKGCGRTVQKYIKKFIPFHLYSTLQIFTFIINIIHGCSVKKSYTKATDSINHRNGYRWLKKLKDKSYEVRAYVNLKTSCFYENLDLESKKWILIFSPLHNMMSYINSSNPLADYQKLTQYSIL